MPSLHFDLIHSTLFAPHQVRAIRGSPRVNSECSEWWRIPEKCPRLDLDSNHYGMCWQCCCVHTIFMHTCFWWACFPFQQAAPVCLCWLTALQLSEPTLPMCMESWKCLRIHGFSPQPLTYACLGEGTDTTGSLDLDLTGKLRSVTYVVFPEHYLWYTDTIHLLDLLFLFPFSWWFLLKAFPTKSL